MRNNRKQRIGIVKSNKMDKTVVVEVNRMVQHRLYKKYIRRSSCYKVHDAENKCQIGDKVVIVETRPLSKDKRWRLKEIIAH